MKKIVLLFVLLFIFNLGHSQFIMYVKENGTGDGSSWENASGDLMAAIAYMEFQWYGEIWVASGTYQPPPNESFTMLRYVGIYGGFNGTETSRDQRDWVANPTYLKGNGASVIYNDTNSLNEESVLDGFYIINGYSETSGGGIYNNRTHPTISNCVFSGNTAEKGGAIFNGGNAANIINCEFRNNTATEGGAIYNIRSNTSYTNCIVENNHAYSKGGAMYNSGSIPMVNFSQFISNTSDLFGGAIANDNFINAVSSSYTLFTDCEFSQNASLGSGGVIHNDGDAQAFFNACIFKNNSTGNSGGTFNNINGSLYFINSLFTNNHAESAALGVGLNNTWNVFVNSTVSENYATDESLIIHNSSNYIIYNSIFINNSGGISNFTGLNAQNSLLQGYAGGTFGNLNGTISYPDLFTDASNGDFSLNPVSSNPAANVGNNIHLELFPVEVTKDLAGNNRVFDNIVDLGAYESQIYLSATYFVDAEKNGDGTSWETAFPTVQAAVSAAEAGDSIFVKKGTYLLNSTITLKDGIKLYGSFNGTESSLAERNLVMDKDEMTRLDGQNTHRVMEAIQNEVTSSTIVDGFTLTRGNTTISEDFLVAGRGAGLLLIETTPEIKNCIFYNNTTATYHGGAAAVISASMRFTNCIFMNNSTQGLGGGLHLEDSNSEVVNCLFVENTSKGGGGLNATFGQEPKIINCTFVRNHAISASGAFGGGGAIRIYGNTTRIYNSVIFGNTSPGYPNIYNFDPDYPGSYTLEYSLVEGASSTDNGNINATGITLNDIFVDYESGNYAITGDSPASNLGSNAAYVDNGGNPETDFDLNANPRIYGATIDLGAFEAQSDCEFVTTWDGSTWSNGLPDFTKQAIIDNDLILDSDLEACEILVTENGSLTIPDGFSFTSEKTIINWASESDFVIENGGNLIQIENYNNGGNINVHRDSDPMIRLEYTLWSSPVMGQNLFNFSPLTVNGVTNYPGSTGRIYVYEGDSGYINPNPFTETTLMNSGTGYLYRAPNNFDTFVPTVYAGVFTGVPFNGNLSATTVPGNYTSIGNPYPSNLDADLLFDTNPGLSTFYFWVNTPLVEGEYTGTSYATYTIAGGTANMPEGDEPSGIIAAGQGFIVFTTDNSVSFDNTMRTSNATNFFKTTDIERNRFWLNLSGENNLGMNQILISYMEGATLGFDHQIDGEMFGYEGSAIYSIIDEKPFSIQGRPVPFESSDVVPIGFKAIKNGKFKIELDNFDGLFADNQTIYLKDNFLGIQHNLNNSAYDFESEEGVFENRFEIVYGEEGSMGTNDLTSNNVLIYKNQNFIEVSSEISPIESVEIFDLQGRKLFSESKINAFTFQINAKQFGLQVLIVNVKTTNNGLTGKKVINN